MKLIMALKASWGVLHFNHLLCLLRQSEEHSSKYGTHPGQQKLVSPNSCRRAFSIIAIFSFDMEKDVRGENTVWREKGLWNCAISVLMGFEDTYSQELWKLSFKLQCLSLLSSPSHSFCKSYSFCKSRPFRLLRPSCFPRPCYLPCPSRVPCPSRPLLLSRSSHPPIAMNPSMVTDL